MTARALKGNWDGWLKNKLDLSETEKQKETDRWKIRKLDHLSIGVAGDASHSPLSCSPLSCSIWPLRLYAHGMSGTWQHVGEPSLYTHTDLADSHSALPARRTCHFQFLTVIWALSRRHCTVFCFSSSLPGSVSEMIWHNTVRNTNRIRHRFIHSVCVGAVIVINKI